MKRHFIKFLFLLIIQVSSIPPCHAQYKTGVGIRAAKFACGIDIKHFFDAPRTVGFEIFGGFSPESTGGYQGRLLLVKQMPIHKSRLQIPTKVVFGVGGHAGFYKDPYFTIKDGEASYYPENTFSAGIDGMFGFEYNSRKVPVTVGLDVIPYYSFLNPAVGWLDFGLNVRYAIR